MPYRQKAIAGAGDRDTAVRIATGVGRPLAFLGAILVLRKSPRCTGFAVGHFAGRLERPYPLICS